MDSFHSEVIFREQLLQEERRLQEPDCKQHFAMNSDRWRLSFRFYKRHCFTMFHVRWDSVWLCRVADDIGSLKCHLQVDLYFICGTTLTPSGWERRCLSNNLSWVLAQSVELAVSNKGEEEFGWLHIAQGDGVGLHDIAHVCWISLHFSTWGLLFFCEGLRPISGAGVAPFSHTSVSPCYTFECSSPM